MWCSYLAEGSIGCYGTGFLYMKAVWTCLGTLECERGFRLNIFSNQSLQNSSYDLK